MFGLFFSLIITFFTLVIILVFNFYIADRFIKSVINLEHQTIDAFLIFYLMINTCKLWELFKTDEPEIMVNNQFKPQLQDYY